jgi:alanine-glyoxylate transaminase / (R)-3-amino-2-methylpropionate-pyruvate transaminase
MNSEEVRRKHREYLFPAVTNFYQEPAVMVEGKGCYLTDLDGKTYLDFFGGVLTISVGHSNEEVNSAVIAQVNRLTHVSTLYPTLPIVELAEKLAEITPRTLQKCFFVTSGTEANEMAMMMAQLATENQEFLALRFGYSGRSLLAQSLTGQASWRALPTQVAAIKHVPAPYCYRCPLKLTPSTCQTACAREIEEIIQTTTTGRVAGLLAEPILGVGGFITPPRDYFAIAAEIVRKHGGIFVADEVQTGFGRTGTMWGVEHYDVEPEAMTMAKGIANGFPLCTIITTDAIAGSLQKSSFSTFGGNPISCAAANATLDVIQKQNLVENSRTQGYLLQDHLLKLQRKYPELIGDVRGKGLMQAIELVKDETQGDRTPNPQALLQLLEETRKRGLLLGKGGLYGNVVRISPPLTVQGHEIEEAVHLLDESLAALYKASFAEHSV